MFWNWTQHPVYGEYLSPSSTPFHKCLNFSHNIKQWCGNSTKYGFQNTGYCVLDHDVLKTESHYVPVGMQDAMMQCCSHKLYDYGGDMLEMWQKCLWCTEFSLSKFLFLACDPWNTEDYWYAHVHVHICVCICVYSYGCGSAHGCGCGSTHVCGCICRQRPRLDSVVEG